MGKRNSKRTSKTTKRAKTTRKRRRAETHVEDYRHDEATRKSIPPAKIAAEGTVPAVPKARYYNSARPLGYPTGQLPHHGAAQ